MISQASFVDTIRDPRTGGDFAFATLIVVLAETAPPGQDAPAEASHPGKAVHLWLGPAAPSTPEPGPPTALLNELAAAVPPRFGAMAPVSPLLGAGVDERSAGLARRLATKFRLPFLVSFQAPPVDDVDLVVEMERAAVRHVGESLAA